MNALDRRDVRRRAEAIPAIPSCTKNSALDSDRPAAGKTGTTNDQHDVWFVGYTPQLLTGVWVGYDQEKSLGGKETGGRAAAPIWHDFMTKALAGEPILDFPVPNEVTLVAVDQTSGQRVTPGSAGAVFQAFKRGTEPGFPGAPAPASAPATSPSRRSPWSARRRRRAAACGTRRCAATDDRRARARPGCDARPTTCPMVRSTAWRDAGRSRPRRPRGPVAGSGSRKATPRCTAARYTRA